ncbi:hypothetical protein VOLCADRAFT_107227 [Volvox carteri f. nagariensis]|uniref:Uncharacterized protein n=1 Tax=Volvox carteri f. nagariensis TaxID=3068 RepID=D8UCQ8_VOLCA|nr:uncharacterized protein VOLCADRAFT_107227 [Volvox carteri f. nagariensis]EFJ42535.1 hypothetical protein VOLCADRAFT_107227 [Volvox carteri f. nagariensis]|eukprot:XP_002956391.1 hypothetical protein VOLCADRAFT_107227 [Volvox carteri f. nagariensis]
MACAVVGQCPVASQKFKGDSSELLDKLVEVCNNVKVVSKAKVVERELQPFCFDNAPPLPKAALRSPPKGRSPRSSPPKQQKAASACSPGGHRKLHPASCTSPPRRGSLDATMNRTRKQAMDKTHFVSLESADDLVRVLRGTSNMMPQPPAASSVRACPGFFSSPRPCDIPMPTSTLLVKATLVKA